MSTAKTTNTPTEAQSRIVSLDILRGFALLGIFIMNMIAFAMVGANYLNPMAEGWLEGADKYAYQFSEIFANTKFMSLFSILFGAGVVLFTERVRLKGLSEAKWHFRRNFWLLIIGLAHAYLIWSGDILVSYAFCSVWVFLFRNKSPKTLYISSAVFFAIGVGLTALTAWSLKYWEPQEIQELCADWTPSAEDIAYEVNAMRGSWIDQMEIRVEASFFMQTFIFLYSMVWKIISMMLLGMGLYKSGILTASKSVSFYKTMAIWCLMVGLGLGAFGGHKNMLHEYECTYSFFAGTKYNTFSSVFMVLGYIGLLMWAAKSKIGPALEKWLAPVGRMALTNYLMQSIIATTIFYGHGFGLFGTMGRASHWLVIIPVWTFQILFSKWWMDRFKFGPAEWGWRTLTYWKRQQM